MQELFTQLTRAIEGSPGLALGASAAWGVLSILLSPCHLASIPLIVGFIVVREGITTRRAFWIALVFAVGILVTIAVIGGVTSALGRMAGDLGGWINYVVAAIFFLVGLHLLDVVPLNFSGAQNARTTGSGLGAAFLLGLVFGVALGPCTFAYMAPVLAVTFKVAAQAPVFAASLLMAYGVGHCSVIVAGGTSAEAVQKYLAWNQSNGRMTLIKRVCGALVLLGGLYMVYTAH